MSWRALLDVKESLIAIPEVLSYHIPKRERFVMPAAKRLNTGKRRHVAKT